MNNINRCLLFLISVSAMLVAGIDNNPLSAGNTQTRNASGNTVEAMSHNPALLGVNRAPKGGVLIPMGNTGIGMWSDKLALSPFNRYWVDSLREGSALMTKILKSSFDLEGLSSSEVSEKLTEEFRGGVTSYFGSRISLFSFARSRIGFDISTHFDEEVTIPEGPLFIIFSETDGLQRGNTLDFSELSQEAIWATDFTFNFGLPVSIPALHDFFKLRYGAGGIGVKYVMGHSILRTETENGTLTYNEESNELDVDGKISVQTAGFGLHGSWIMENPFSRGIPVSGHGIGVDLGGILYDDHGTLTVNVQNLGVLFWMNDVKQVTYQIDKDDLDAYDIIDGVEIAREQGRDERMVIFNRDEGEYISTEDDTLVDGSGFATFLPLSLNIGYSHSWDLSGHEKEGVRMLAEYLKAGANYEQQLSKGPGRSFIPRLSIGGEAGTFRGYFPIRLGWVFGGSERIASAVGASFNFKYVSLNASFKAVGTPYFYPKRGIELAGGINVNWGMQSDKDKDGILDRDDECPGIAEDIDGFEDEDGCPDPDNDQDGIADTLDECINDPEDLDGFEDEDGCPDYDNDGDGIPDSVDQCPMEPEDHDGFEDEDGCPELDNDLDGVPDSVDKCYNTPEDIDGFEDEDGCPDFDNDKDAIADSVDNCPMEPEVYNGFQDEDGCPDTLVKPTEKEEKELNTQLRSINFKSGSAELRTESYRALDFIAKFLKEYPHLRYEVQGHTDSQGSDKYNLVLSAARAGTVRSYLLSKGISEPNLIAIGYGESVPIADNRTAQGRARNRRVEFRVIETNDEYSVLKVREEEFERRVREAKIKGYRP